MGKRREQVKLCYWCEERPADTVAWDWDICWECFREMHEPTPTTKLMRTRAKDPQEGAK